VRVVPPPGRPPRRILIAKGSVPAGEHIPVSLPAAGRVDIVVDWSSPLNKIIFSFYKGNGTCRQFPCPGAVVEDLIGERVKPLPASADNVPPGDYTLWVAGTPVETVRYEVRLTPK